MKLKADPDKIVARFTDLHPEIPSVLNRVAAVGWKQKRSLAPEQVAALYALAKPYNHTSTRILEIGTAFGYSAAALAEACPLAHIVTLNPATNEVQAAKTNLRSYGNVTCVTVKSWDYLKNYIGTGFDVVFIDGDHNAIGRDLAWWEHVRPGGVMILHDYSPNNSPRPCQPVFDAANRFAEQLGFHEPPIVIRDMNDVGLAAFPKESERITRPDPYYVVVDAKPYSIMDVNQLRSLFDLALTALANGDVVECGVGNGGSASVLYQGVKCWASLPFDLWAFGSPEGVEPPDEVLDGAKAVARYKKNSWGSHDPAYTRDVLLKATPAPRLHYFPGWFRDTFKGVNPAPIALLHIDANTYLGTRESLDRWYASVVPGGLVLVSAYNYWPGVRKAVENFFGYQPDFLFGYDDLNVAWRKV